MHAVLTPLTNIFQPTPKSLNPIMRIMLAPMEGVVDHTMRDMLTQIGGIDRCVTEFVRVTSQRLPNRVFYRLCPELHNNGKTPSGVPVYIQLLGGQPEPMAANAERAANLGAPGIDINFGCPAKTVNKNDGGSVLLREPQRLFDIVSAVRQAVPTATPVTAKIRLGYQDHSQLDDITDAILEAGADELTIHARTKADGYKPPAFWHHIDAIQQKANIPVIANGEIWTPKDYQQCIKESGCSDIMLGRGLLTRPDLALQIRATAKGEQAKAMCWSETLSCLANFSKITEEMYEPKYVGNRVKQWLGYLRQANPFAQQLFEQVKRLKCAVAIYDTIVSHQTDYLAIKSK